MLLAGSPESKEPAVITMLGSPRRCCDGITRRESLKVGALSALGGLSLVDLLRQTACADVPAPSGKAKSVILLYLLGGAPTQDMWDLKPDAPSEVRGEFQPIATNVPGIQICELLPRTAQWMHRGAIVRSVNHNAGCHNTLPSYTGHEVSLSDITITKEHYPPSMGSVCSYLFPATGQLPAYLYLPCYLGWGQNIRRPGPYGGFLGKRFDPLFTECRPYGDDSQPAASPGHPRTVRGLPYLPYTDLPADMTLDRLNQRHDLLEQFDQGRTQLDARAAGISQMERAKQQAYSLLTSAETRAAFDLSAEPPERVERYGKTLFGQSTLIARRLIESGVRFVNVSWDLYWDRVQIDYDCWDTHTRNFPILKENKLPPLDQTLTALLEDLEGRGMLDETLVVVMSEMGRTPRINGSGGRDHWTHCYSAVFFGGGIRGGTVYGESDEQAAYVKDRPVSTADICCTVYHCLGIDPQTMVPDRLGRPNSIAHGGSPIRDILA
jgi:hypothetical protein